MRRNWVPSLSLSFNHVASTLRISSRLHGTSLSLSQPLNLSLRASGYVTLHAHIRAPVRIKERDVYTRSPLFSSTLEVVNLTWCPICQKSNRLCLFVDTWPSLGSYWTISVKKSFAILTLIAMSSALLFRNNCISLYIYCRLFNRILFQSISTTLHIFLALILYLMTGGYVETTHLVNGDSIGKWRWSTNGVITIDISGSVVFRLVLSAPGRHCRQFAI